MVGMFILISGVIMDVAILIFTLIYGDINILVSALLAYRAGRKPGLFFYSVFIIERRLFLFFISAPVDSAACTGLEDAERSSS